MLNSAQEIKRLLETSRHALIVFGGEKNDDAVAASLALRQFLRKQNKQVDIVSPDFQAPKQLSFITDLNEIKNSLSHLQKMIIKVDVSKVKIDTVSYDLKDNWLSIYLTPKHGLLTKNELRTAQSAYKYDLIITLNTPELEALNDIFYNNTDLFYRLPIINIDHRAGNEQYGQINVVDLVATSVSEIIFKIMEEIDATRIDGEIATALLAGMISQTKSFKTPNVTPDSLHLASRLINLGADREKIIRHLYWTKSLSGLKLWGRALANLQHDREIGLTWTTVTRDDFVRSGADEEDLRDLASEIISGSPEAKIILALYENPTINANEIRGLITAERDFDASELVKSFKPTGNKKTASFILANKSLKEAETAVLNEIRQRAKPLLNLL